MLMPPTDNLFMGLDVRPDLVLNSKSLLWFVVERSNDEGKESWQEGSQTNECGRALSSEKSSSIQATSSA
jgi:hypothetical protein